MSGLERERRAGRRIRRGHGADRNRRGGDPVSDLTPEETLRANVTTVGYSQCAVCDKDRPPLETPEEPCGCDHTNAHIVCVDAVPLDVALAAVAAERECCGERLLSDEAVKEATEAWGFAGEGENLAVSRAALSAAWRVVTGSKGDA